MPIGRCAVRQPIRLEKIGGPRALDALLAELASLSSERARPLAPPHGPTACVPAPDPFPNGMIAGFVAIGQPAVEPLIATLRRDASNLIAVTALGEIGDLRAVKPLIATFRAPPCYSTYCVIRSLVKIGRVAVEPLIAALDDPNVTVRSHAASVLQQRKDRLAADPLWAVYNDPRNEKADARQEAVNFLVEIRDPRLYDRMVSAAASRESGQRAEAIFVLGRVSRSARSSTICCGVERS